MNQLKRPLLLQGPVGYFFTDLQDQFAAKGAQPLRLLFNGGDAFFARKNQKTCFFKGQPEEFLQFFKQVITEHKTDGIVLFGDCRPLHKIGIEYAKSKGLKVFVFEEGYVRPNFITLEKDGVNAHSKVYELNAHLTERGQLEQYYLSYPVGISREQIAQLQKEQYHSMRHQGFWAVLYWVGMFLRQGDFPHYIHHKQSSLLHQGWSFARGYVRSWNYKIKEFGAIDKIIKKSASDYFVMCLQVSNDSQIKEHSGFRGNKGAIYQCLKSLSHCASGSHIVIKQHPLDLGYHDYEKFIKRLSKHFGLTGRVWFVHNVSLPKLLKSSKGMVTINSTAGLSALFHGIPVKVLGKAIYDIEGLCFQGKLDAFWSAANVSFRVDKKLYEHFRAFLIEQTQVPGSFYNKNHFPKILMSKGESKEEAQTSANVLEMDIVLKEPRSQI